jgi:sentrin-specific protease 7
MSIEVIDIDSDNDENQQESDPIMIKNLFSVTIKESDYRRLDPQIYLNDNLIDFFLGNTIKNKKDFYAFNSFFYTTLIDQGFEKIQKWYRNIDLFKKKYWIIPVAIMEHWILVIVTYPLNAFTKNNPQPRILVFDSMNLKSLNPKFELETYIYNEWVSRGGQDIKINIPLYMLRVPQQSNLWDCGVFILEYAERFVKRPKLFESHSDFNEDFEDWFEPEELEDKRLRLKNNILSISSYEKIGITKYKLTDQVSICFKYPTTQVLGKRSRKPIVKFE